MVLGLALGLTFVPGYSFDIALHPTFLGIVVAIALQLDSVAGWDNSVRSREAVLSLLCWLSLLACGWNRSSWCFLGRHAHLTPGQLYAGLVSACLPCRGSGLGQLCIPAFSLRTAQPGNERSKISMSAGAQGYPKFLCYTCLLRPVLHIEFRDGSHTKLTRTIL